MKVQEILDRTIQFFRDKKLDSPRLDAELLISRALGYRRIDLYLKFDQPLAEADVVKCREVVRRRSQGEPVAYILGEKDFYGLTFQVDSRVLVPRPETEMLAEAALEVLGKLPKEDALEVLDLGSGSGCLGLTLATKTPNARVTMVDLSEQALQVAQGNAEKLGVANRCDWLLGDAAEVDLQSKVFDLIVANPPYIANNDPRVQASVAQFEPHLALYANEGGFSAIQSWARHSVRNLKPGGWIGFEFGIDQDQLAKELFTSLGLTDVKIIVDLSGLPRHVVGRKGSNHG